MFDVNHVKKYRVGGHLIKIICEKVLEGGQRLKWVVFWTARTLWQSCKFFKMILWKTVQMGCWQMTIDFFACQKRPSKFDKKSRICQRFSWPLKQSFPRHWSCPTSLKESFRRKRKDSLNFVITFFDTGYKTYQHLSPLCMTVAKAMCTYSLGLIWKHSLVVAPTRTCIWKCILRRHYSWASSSTFPSGNRNLLRAASTLQLKRKVLDPFRLTSFCH